MKKFLPLNVKRRFDIIKISSSLFKVFFICSLIFLLAAQVGIAQASQTDPVSSAINYINKYDFGFPSAEISFRILDSLSDLPKGGRSYGISSPHVTSTSTNQSKVRVYTLSENQGLLLQWDFTIDKTLSQVSKVQAQVIDIGIGTPLRPEGPFLFEKGEVIVNNKPDRKSVV